MTTNPTELERHHIALNLLATLTGAPNTDGAYLYSKLKPLERKAHKAAERYCNGTVSDKSYVTKADSVTKRIEKLFGILPFGFFINSDPRGYALKINDTETKALRNKGINLQTDWGGYGLLAPDIGGD